MLRLAGKNYVKGGRWSEAGKAYSFSVQIATKHCYQTLEIKKKNAPVLLLYFQISNSLEKKKKSECLDLIIFIILKPLNLN